MIKEFRLPDLGEGLTESEILSWKVAVGDSVVLNQVIAEVETAKAVVELPSPYTGTVAALHEQPGAVVEVGKPIVSFEVDETVVSAEPKTSGTPTREAEPPQPIGTGEADTTRDETIEADKSKEAKPAPKREPSLVGYGAVIEEDTGRPVRRARSFSAASATAPVATAPSQTDTRPAAGTAPEVEPAATRPRSTPPVRKLARDLGVDLRSVPGTGPGGLITRDDVRGFAGEATAGPVFAVAAAPAVAGASPRETRTPIKGVRKYTAAAMVSSAFTAPHVTEFLTVDVTASMELLDRLRSSRQFTGHKLTPLTIVAKALLIALRRNPTLNSHWDEEHREIVQFNYVNLGIAAATPRGLTVPNIKDAQDMSLLEISTALAELTEKARAGKSTPEDLSAGTITITNIGVFGIDAGTAVLNPGEAAILAVGAVRTTPWEHAGAVALRQVMTLSLSFDHRLVDGEQGSKFLADIGTVLRDPGMVLTMV